MNQGSFRRPVPMLAFMLLRALEVKAHLFRIGVSLR
jgi:hypothetical protein